MEKNIKKKSLTFITLYNVTTKLLINNKKDWIKNFNVLLFYLILYLIPLIIDSYMHENHAHRILRKKKGCNSFADNYLLFHMLQIAPEWQTKEIWVKMAWKLTALRYLSGMPEATYDGLISNQSYQVWSKFYIN